MSSLELAGLGVAVLLNSPRLSLRSPCPSCRDRETVPRVWEAHPSPKGYLKLELLSQAAEGLCLDRWGTMSWKAVLEGEGIRHAYPYCSPSVLKEPGPPEVWVGGEKASSLARHPHPALLGTPSRGGWSQTQVTLTGKPRPPRKEGFQSPLC